MRKILKFIGWTFLVLIVLVTGFAIYTYQTNPMLKAIVNNDESKLYYFPVKEMDSMDELDYSVNIMNGEDSINIYTYQFQPSSDEIEGNIFFIHGAGGNVSRYKNLIKPLVENGFKVYAVDWRGYGKSNGVPNYKGVLKDTQMAFNDFIEKTRADNLKTIVYGLSLGGQLGVKIAKDNQDKIDALVLDGSIESAQKLAIDYAPIAYLKEKARNSPDDFNQDYVAINDIKEISNIPKLIIHSKNDREVSFEQGKNLFKAAKEPKEFWVTDTKHMMTLKEYPKETVEKVRELIR